MKQKDSTEDEYVLHWPAKNFENGQAVKSAESANDGKLKHLVVLSQFVAHFVYLAIIASIVVGAYVGGHEFTITPLSEPNPATVFLFTSIIAISVDKLISRITYSPIRFVTSIVSVLTVLPLIVLTAALRTDTKVPLRNLVSITSDIGSLSYAVLPGSR